MNISVWPATLPDLSHIENLWNIMKNKVEKAGEKKPVNEWKEDLIKIRDETVFDALKSFMESKPQ